jgi:hypothetical protein
LSLCVLLRESYWVTYGRESYWVTFWWPSFSEVSALIHVTTSIHVDSHGLYTCRQSRSRGRDPTCACCATQSILLLVLPHHAKYNNNNKYNFCASRAYTSLRTTRNIIIIIIIEPSVRAEHTPPCAGAGRVRGRRDP